MQNTNQSEIARLQQQIALEYEASRIGLTGLSATASHAYITARQQNIARCFAELVEFVTPEEAMALLHPAGLLSEEER